MLEHEPDDDAHLMVRVADGDTDALCSLIERWQAPLGSFVYRYVQNREATQELVQETFVRLYEARARYDSKMRFSSWLFKIASNLCKNYYRWRSRHPESLGWDESTCMECGASPNAMQDDEDPAEINSKREEIAVLERAVASMPHPLKVTLLLYYYESQSYKDIAHTLGCSVRGVETRLYRARAWLAKRLSTDPMGSSFGGRNLLAVPGIQL
ncbi:MAG: RNA polymerase sigma factor [Opitutales bacterium]|jgi:RNA polymerase sigma-70 factor (ECF subfamily)